MYYLSEGRYSSRHGTPGTHGFICVTHERERDRLTGVNWILSTFNRLDRPASSISIPNALLFIVASAGQNSQLLHLDQAVH